MIRVLDYLPQGWRYINASTNPNGYVWACNGKSRFSNEYDHALIKDKQ